jgi:hypothetical protein
MTEFDQLAGQNHYRIVPMGVLADLPGGNCPPPKLPTIPPLTMIVWKIVQNQYSVCERGRYPDTREKMH